MSESEHICDKHGPYVSRDWLLPGGAVFSMGCPECRRERNDKEEAAKNKNEELLFKVKQHNAGIGARYYDSSFDNFRVTRDEERTALKHFRNYTNDFARRDSPNLIVYGDTGTGKTHLACAMASDLIRRDFSVMYLPVLSLFTRYQDIAGYGGEGSREAFYSNLYGVDLLIIDEFGILSLKESERVVLHRVIDDRYSRKAPIVLIGNISLPNLEQEVGERALRRCMSFASIVQMDWKKTLTGELFAGE